MSKPRVTLDQLLQAQAQRDTQPTRAQLPPWLRGDLPERRRQPQPTHADPTANTAGSNIDRQRKQQRRRSGL